MKEKCQTIYPRSYLEWGFDEDNLQNYKFVVDNASGLFVVGDEIILKVFSRPYEGMKDKVLDVDDNSMVVHTKGNLDIMEEYDISKNI